MSEPFRLGDAQDDFSKLLGLFQVVVRGHAIGQVEDLVHHGLQAALSHELHHRTKLAFRAHVRAQDGKLADKQKPDVDVRVEAGGGAAGHQAPAVGQALDAVIPGGGADVFEDYVHAAAVGETPHLLGNWHDAVMNHFVGAEFPSFGDLFVGAGGGNHAGTEESGDLDGRAAYAAAGGKDEHIFSGLELRTIDEHVPGGLKDQRHGGGVGPVEIFGIRHAVYFGDMDVFRAAAVNQVAQICELAAAVVIAGNAGRTFAAAHAGREHHLLADVHGGHRRADLDDFARHVAPQNMRHGKVNSGEAPPDPQVQVIQRAGAHAHQNFVRAYLRLRYVRVVQHRRVPVLVNDHRFHACPPGYISAISMLSLIYRITIWCTLLIA